MSSVPDILYTQLDKEFGFTLSVHDFPDHPLKHAWTGVVWCHPPTGRGIKRWLEKAYRSALRGNRVVCLLPSSTDTTWWHDYVMKSTEVRFLRGRLTLKGYKNTAPYASVVVVFDQDSGSPRFTQMQGYRP